jgi:urease accessory protein
MVDNNLQRLPPSSILPPCSPQLSIRIARSATNNQAFIAHQYASYPFRLSGNLRLDPADPERVYAYIMNASPGLLAGDDWQVVVEVSDRANLYLTDQSATKVHSHPAHSHPNSSSAPSAQVGYTFNVGAGAYLEYIPEPVILFKAAALTQQMTITLHPQGQLVLSEIIVPGRLAKGEFYAFNRFYSHLRVQTPKGKLCFADSFRLLGETNRFKHSPFVTDWPIVANLIAVVPGVDLAQLAQMLENHALPTDELQVCDSPLPGCHGLWVRAIATQVAPLKRYQHHLLDCIRNLTGHRPLPAIPK